MQTYVVSLSQIYFIFTSVQRHFLHIGQFRMAFNVLPDVSLFTFF